MNRMTPHQQSPEASMSERRRLLEGKPVRDVCETLAECDAALSAPAEAPEVEPVAWRVRGYAQFKTGKPGPWRYFDGASHPSINTPDCCDVEPVYAHPPAPSASPAEPSDIVLLAMARSLTRLGYYGVSGDDMRDAFTLATRSLVKQGDQT